MARLRAKNPGALSSVSFNGQEYKVGRDGSVEVPDNAAAHLIESHGFAHHHGDEGDDGGKAEVEKNRGSDHEEILFDAVGNRLSDDASEDQKVEARQRAAEAAAPGGNNNRQTTGKRK